MRTLVSNLLPSREKTMLPRAPADAQPPCSLILAGAASLRVSVPEPTFQTRIVLSSDMVAIRRPSEDAATPRKPLEGP